MVAQDISDQPQTGARYGLRPMTERTNRLTASSGRPVGRAPGGSPAGIQGWTGASRSPGRRPPPLPQGSDRPAWWQSPGAGLAALLAVVLGVELGTVGWLVHHVAVAIQALAATVATGGVPH